MINKDVEFFLNEYCGKGKLYLEDKNEIVKMYTNMKEYNYEDIFHTSKYKILKTRNLKFFNKEQQIEYISGVLEPISNKINKIMKIKKECKYKEILCINFLREVYFQKLAQKYIINENIIIPEIYDYGYIIKDDDVIYFFEMEYYECVFDDKEIVDIGKDLQQLIYKVEINHKKINIILNNYLTFCKGVEYLEYIEKEYNIYHNDYTTFNWCSMDYNDIKSDISFHVNKSIFTSKIKEIFKKVCNNYENKIERLYKSIKPTNNIIINEKKCIIIDFGHCFRKNIV
jgi:hypothetical protein